MRKRIGKRNRYLVKETTKRIEEKQIQSILLQKYSGVKVCVQAANSKTIKVWGVKATGAPIEFIFNYPPKKGGEHYDK